MSKGLKFIYNFVIFLCCLCCVVIVIEALKGQRSKQLTQKQESDLNKITKKVVRNSKSFSLEEGSQGSAGRPEKKQESIKQKSKRSKQKQNRRQNKKKNSQKSVQRLSSTDLYINGTADANLTENSLTIGYHNKSKQAKEHQVKRKFLENPLGVRGETKHTGKEGLKKKSKAKSQHTHQEQKTQKRKIIKGNQKEIKQKEKKLGHQKKEGAQHQRKRHFAMPTSLRQSFDDILIDAVSNATDDTTFMVNYSNQSNTPVTSEQLEKALFSNVTRKRCKRGEEINSKGKRQCIIMTYDSQQAGSPKLQEQYFQDQPDLKQLTKEQRQEMSTIFHDFIKWNLKFSEILDDYQRQAVIKALEATGKYWMSLQKQCKRKDIKFTDSLKTIEVELMLWALLHYHNLEKEEITMFRKSIKFLSVLQKKVRKSRPHIAEEEPQKERYEDMLETNTLPKMYTELALWYLKNPDLMTDNEKFTLRLIIKDMTRLYKDLRKLRVRDQKQSKEKKGKKKSRKEKDVNLQDIKNEKKKAKINKILNIKGAQQRKIKKKLQNMIKT